MHLYYFLLVISALACGSVPPREVDLSNAVLSSLSMVAGWILLTHIASRMVSNYVKRGEVEPLDGAQIVEKQLDIFRWLGLGVSVLCLAGFGLARGLDVIPIVQDSMFLQSLVLLTPAVAITVGTWSSEHLYGVRLQYTDATISNYARTLWRSFRSGMAWLVVPVLILLAMSDALNSLPISATASSVLTLVGIALFVPLVLPWLIRHLFKTVPMANNDADWINELMKQSGARRTRAVRWDTGGSAFNAMIAGFIPPFRTLFLSDRLLDELPTPQIAMVVLHEAAHLKRRHVPLRMLGILPAWGVGTLVTKVLGDYSWAMIAGSAVGVLLTLVLLRWISYRTEHDADVTACRLAAKLAPEFPQLPADYDEACDALSAALYRVTFDQPAGRKATWLHPGVSDRVDFMRKFSQARSGDTAISHSPTLVSFPGSQ
ncbi:Peptidase family M48 [Rubripirellula amarantea]|uniref:Peptidase family M48 n=1 Tax=Rubripirellula amarantea TaxID=2527999 RepID=A0A5C5WE81_9BACT|nr:M48 family metalloprotease [Rubripirellula amarantea]TWT49128.1 Peptidase family M48 [Rubripirellula amarantea]